MNVHEIHQLFISVLEKDYSPEEAGGVIALVFEDVLNFSRIDLFTKKETKVSNDDHEKFIRILEELKNGRPVQYALGYTWFCGIKILVSESVLIPRRETEELVKWVADDNKKNPAQKVLDLCTGSGCIALALKFQFPQLNIEGCDISEDALIVAQMNAQSLKMNVEFFEADVLNLPIDKKYSVITCNPPYVLWSESPEMEQRVTAFEPELALFVRDDDPLLFYKKVAGWALKSLSAGGSLYFEINEKYGKELMEMIRSIGYKNVILRKDMQAKERMIKATI